MRDVRTSSKCEFRYGYKNWDEMTNAEKIATKKYNKKDFKYILDWYITYRHDGTLDRVQPGKYAKGYSKKYDEDEGIDMVDSMQLLYGKKNSKNYKAAKKRVGVSESEINAARRVINGKH